MATTTTSSISTSNPYLTGLLHDDGTGSTNVQNVRHWANGPVTYYLTRGDYNQNGIEDWSENGAAAAFRKALGLWQAVAGVSFAETRDGNDSNLVERFGSANGNLGTHNYPNQGNVSVGTYDNHASSFNDGARSVAGSYSYTTFVHELGHALGLEHPHSDSAGNRFPGVDSASDKGDHGLNQQIFSIMSYNMGWDGDGGDPNSSYGWVATPMAFDIAAVQAIYGKNLSTATGSNTYVLPTANQIGTSYACIWDAGGNDTISAANATVGVTINLNDATLKNEAGGGGFVSRAAGVYGGFTIANGAIIENAVGGKGNDTLTGNEYANHLTGGAGNDILTGGAGKDTLIGGAGNDTYHLGADADAVDVVRESANAGHDTVTSAITRSLNSSEYANIDALTINGTAAINATGNALNNVLTGNVAANILNGLGGSDTLRGMGGNDLYVVAAGDAVDETAAGSGGADTVFSSITYKLGTSVENLALTGSATINATGNGLDNSMSGNAANNVMLGLEGRDTLRGAGGADTLTGGAGGDTFLYAAGGDSLVFARDRILDFDDNGNDVINLVPINGAQPLTWQGDHAFTGINQVRVERSGSDVLVSLNLDLNPMTIEMQIVLVNTTLSSVTQSDFLL